MLDAVITQNIDMLHRKAGTREIVEVHGTIEHSSCLVCGDQYPLAETRARLVADDPRRAALRLRRAAEARRRAVRRVPAARARSSAPTSWPRGADVLLCIGSSLEVHPIAQLPGVTRAAGGAVAIITQGPTPFDARADGAARRRRRRRARGARRRARRAGLRRSAAELGVGAGAQRRLQARERLRDRGDPLVVDAALARGVRRGRDAAAAARASSARRSSMSACPLHGSSSVSAAS